MRVLIYTDSRGQHTPRGAEAHAVFGERLAQRTDIETELVLCPMKWTTTIDFLDYLAKRPPNAFDAIVLNTGIVDWSPRPQPSAINDLYDNKTPANLDNERLNTREYAKKVVNWKKPSFDGIFTESQMRAHLARDFGVAFEGQPTINMYGLEMAENALLPRLAQLDNLIFINSNRFVPGWKGDHARGRPENIAYTEKYSALFRDALGPRRTIDLLAWDEADIQRFTCDNIHFTKAGSDFLYEQICQRAGLGRVMVNGHTPSPQPNGASTQASPLGARPASTAPAPFSAFGRPLMDPVRLMPREAATARASAGRGPQEKLATLIIGVRFPDDDKSRVDNLEFLLSWIDHFYGDLFDVLLVEQDDVSRIGRISHALKPYVRHVFLFNPSAYNRGWGYNVAIKHHTDLPVVALMDTDVLTGANFLQEIIDCHGKYKAVSPYANIYFTNANEAALVIKTKSTRALKRENGVRKPTTIAGGVLIMNREAYLSVGGFEQYTSYGGEDRALDVALMNRFPADQIRVAPFVYPHLFHPSTDIVQENLDGVLAHLRENYGCSVDMTLTGADDIHKNCAHAPPAKTEAAIAARAVSFGDPLLYAAGAPLSVNGVPISPGAASAATKAEFPPAFESLDSYEKREIYEAPEPDSERIAALYNKFRGKRCFIVGNGPSLNNHDLSMLEGEYVFAVNSFFYKTQETGFRPTFYVVEDNMVMRENIAQIKAFEAPYKFFPTNYAALHPKGDNVYFFRMNRGFYEKSSPNYCTPRFSTDASDVLYCGQSVTFINLQLAYFLGFTEVYLIGMDFDYVIPPDFKRNGDLIVSTADDPNHFHKDYFGVGKTWKDPKLDRVALNYKQAKIAYESVGRRIYNATIGGKLEIFERVDYNALLRKPATAEEAAPRLLRASAPRQGTGEPLISIIVPAYNVETYLAECLDSLITQDDPNFEIVIVDDGSTDSTPAIIADYCARHPNIASVWRPNGGLGAARNTGVEYAKGEFVLYVDSDDYVSRSAISALRSKQKEGDHDIVTGRFVRVSEDGVPQDVKTDALPQHEIPKGSPPLSPGLKVLGAFAPSIACARLYRTSFLRENDLDFPGRAPHEDLYFTYKALTLSKSNAEIADEIYFYRQRDGSISKAISKAHIDTLFAQWCDTDDFIAKTGAPPLARALVARRTIFLLEGFRKRAAASEETARYLKQRLSETRVGMHTLLADFRNSKIADSYVPQVAVKLIETLPIDTSIAPAFEPANVVYPFDKINFESYKARETGNATEADRQALARFHNAYKGKRCFIIGNGPSLNQHDLSLLKDEYTFAVNSFFYKTEETGFTPTFFVVEDNLVMRENIERIKAYDAPFKFFPSEYKELHPEGPNVYFYSANAGFYLQSSPNYCVPRFSTDATKAVFNGQTVTFANLQLAYFMGFTEVYLIGMDFHYVVPDAHGRKGNWILSTTDDPNHFHKDYFGAGKTWKDPKLDRVANAYRQARLAFEATGRKVMNASAGGKLEIFERIDYASLFRSKQTTPAMQHAAPSRQPAPRIEARVADVAPPPVRAPSAAASVVAAPPFTAPQLARPFYAGFGEWLQARSPRTFHLMRFLRRTAAGAWRRRAWTIPLALLFAAFPLSALLPALAPFSGLIWGASAFALLLFAIVYAALRFQLHVDALAADAAALRARLAHSEEQLARALGAAQARSESEFGTLIKRSVNALRTEARQAHSELNVQTDALRADVNTAFDTAANMGTMLRQDIDDAAQTVRAETQAALGAFGHDVEAKLQAVHAEARKALDAVNALDASLKAAIHADATAQAELASQAKEADAALKAELLTAVSESTEEAKKLFRHQRSASALLDERLTAGERQIGAVAEAQSAAEQKIGKLSERSVSTHLAAALRSMRPFWTGISAVKALQNQAEFEHGHELMMAVLADEERQRPGAVVGKCLIEVGTTREAAPAQSSTQKLALFTAMMGMRFITVDMDPENTKAANTIMRQLNPAAQALTGRGEDYLPRHPGPLEFVYLDAFDFDHGMHSEARKDKYRKFLGTDITDPACWKMHEACAETIVARMEPGGIVVLDDTWKDENSRFAGKGKLAVPLLLDHGFQIIARTRQTFALKRVSPTS